MPEIPFFGVARWHIYFLTPRPLSYSLDTYGPNLDDPNRELRLLSGAILV